jgi:hypothetical protein
MDVVTIGDQYPSAIFLKDENEEALGLVKSSLNLARCSNPMCSLVQLGEPVNLDIVYKYYPYQSGTTATMHEILSDVVAESMKVVDVGDDDVILDIGGNDGTLLSLIKKQVHAKVNIDAASRIDQVLQDSNYYYINEKFSALHYPLDSLGKPKLIYCVAVFYQVLDPFKFAEDISNLMSSDSLFVLQMTYLGSMLENNIFDNIVHEHLTYFSLFSLSSLMKRVGLKIVGAKVVNSYGGSLRAYIVKEDSTINVGRLEGDMRDLIQQEMDWGVNSASSLVKFGARFDYWKEFMTETLKFYYRSYGPLAGMGASTKGNMLLQALEIDSQTVSYILDNNSKKIGTRTTGSSIQIIDENSIEILPENILSLAYYYNDFFIDLLRKKLAKDRVINFISPLPVPKIYRISGL